MSGKGKAVPQAWMKRRGLCHQGSFERCRKCQQQHILINLLISLGQKEKKKKRTRREGRRRVGKGGASGGGGIEGAGGEDRESVEK